MNKITRNMFPKLAEKFDKKICVSCNKKVNEIFKDERSKREYEISGLCQICQDKTFK